jgi:FkbM family methyltransferase
VLISKKGQIPVVVFSTQPFSSRKHFMSIGAGVKSYYNLFGVRGLWAISSFRVFGKPREIVSQPPAVRHPVHLRVRTSDISLYNDILLRKEYDLGLQDFSPQTIVDAGANCGMATLYYANRYPDAKIVAVEPEPSNFAALVKNVAPYPNVVPIHAALWNKDGKVRLGPTGLDSTPYGKWAFQVSDSGAPVRAITMQTLMAEAKIDTVELLKMDVEGGEIEAFENCDWMSGVQVIVIELHDHIKPGCRAVVSSAAKGFRQWERGEMTFFAREGRCGTTAILDNPGLAQAG